MIDSLLLGSINSNVFLPFQYHGFQDGTDGETNFDTLSLMIKQNNYSIDDIKESNSYSTWKYCINDSKELYFKNLKTQPNDWYYKNNPVNYTLNSFGYRTKNFNEIDWSNSIVIFGCSHVLGCGLDDSHTLSSFLEKDLNMPVVNMGVCSSSNEFHLYNSNILLTQYPKPKAVIYSLTGLQRYPFYHWDHVQHRGPWDLSNREIKHNRSNSIMRSIVASNTMNNIWSSRTTYIEYSTDIRAYKFLNTYHKNSNRHYLGTNWQKLEELKLSDKVKDFDFPGQDYARDLSHPGRRSNEIIAKSLAKILKSRID